MKCAQYTSSTVQTILAQHGRMTGESQPAFLPTEEEDWQENYDNEAEQTLSQEPFWSEFQNEIFTFGEEEQRNLVIQAVAGAGKTSTLFELARRIGGEILFLAFGKEIAEYAKGKLKGYPNIDVRTFHSFGMQLLPKAIGFYADVDTNKLTLYFNSIPDFDRRRFDRDEFYPKFIARRIVKQIRQLGMMSYDVEDIREFIRFTPGLFAIDPRKRAQEEAWVFKNILQFPHWLIELDALPIRPKKGKDGKKINTYQTVIDFDSMVRLPCIHNLVEKYPVKQSVALVDELQDMNPYQVHTINQLRQCGVRIIGVGDRHQAIFFFRGSYVDSMDRVKETLKAHELPLSVTYRSRKNIVEYVNANISGSEMSAYKDGGEVRTITRESFIQDVLKNDVRMIVGARNKSLLECWILLAKHKISSTLKGSGVVKEIRDMIYDIKPEDLDDLCETLQEAVLNAVTVNDDGEMIYKESPTRVELMDAIPELIESYGISSLGDFEKLLNEMEKDAVRELHTVHSAKGLEASSVVVLGDWFPCEQLENMQYVALTRAENILLLVADWHKVQEEDNRERNT